MAISDSDAEADTQGSTIAYDIRPTDQNRDQSRFVLYANDIVLGQFDDSAALLHGLETHVLMGLQQARPELFFVHAAALEFAGNAHLLVAASGQGKSTTAWALLQSGFRYLSDELAPVDPVNMHVHGYPHALCLKDTPPAPFGLPGETLQTSATLHVPSTCVPLAPVMKTCPLGSLWFVQFDVEACEPRMHRVSTAESSARLYAQGLNLLAHRNVGLDAAAKIAGSVPGYCLTTSVDLEATSQLISRVVLEDV